MYGNPFSQQIEKSIREFLKGQSHSERKMISKGAEKQMEEKKKWTTKWTRFLPPQLAIYLTLITCLSSIMSVTISDLPVCLSCTVITTLLEEASLLP